MAVTGKSEKSLIDLQINNSLLHSEFDSYKLSLEPVPIFEKHIDVGVAHIELSSDQYSFLHVRLFGLHNHLYCDPWKPLNVYYFNNEGTLVQNTWNSTERSFACLEVWSDIHQGKDNGDYNYSLNLDCKEKLLIYDGRKNGTLTILNTGDRSDENNKWKDGDSIEVTCIPPGVLVSCEWSADDDTYHCLLQSVVEAANIEPLKITSEQQGQAFATMLQWLSIGKVPDKKYEITSQRQICVHGAVDYAALEQGAKAIYVASQKEAFYAQDTTRPITPMLVRALREPLHYTWTQEEDTITLRFTLPWTLHQEDVQVHHKHEDGVFTVDVIAPEHSHCVISGKTSLTLAGCEPSQCNVKDGRVEIQLKKGICGETWEEFIPGDVLGHPTPNNEQVKEAQEALKHLNSEKEEEGELVQGFNCGQLEECDALPADSAMLVRMSSDSHTPSHRVCLSAHQWISNITLTPGKPSGVLLRHDVDALAWQPEPPHDKHWDITHTGTFPAFGYVQASKEQKKFILSPPDLSYVAICESSRHVYLYHQPSPLSSELRNRKTGSKVAAVARQQVARTPESVTHILGACAGNQVLFILAKNCLLAMTLQ